MSAFAALASPPAMQEKRLLRVRSAPGERYAYTIRSEITPVGVEGRMAFSMTMARRLLVAQPGKLVWSMYSSDFKLDATGVFAGARASFEGMDRFAYRVVTNERGEVLRVQTGGMSLPSQGSAEIVFPARPVDIGDSWDAPVEVGGAIVRIRYTLSGITEEGGVPAAVITGEYLPGQPIVSIAPTEFLVDLKTGQTLHSSGAFELTVGAQKIRGRFRLARLDESRR